MQDEEDAAALGRRMRNLRGTTSQASLSRKVHIHRTRISKAENGELPSAQMCAAYDAHFGTGGELAAWQARLVVAGHRSGEENTTDRREFGELTLAAILATAGDASDAMATADPPPLTLEEMEAEAEAIYDSIYDVHPEALLRRAATRWHEAYVLLSRPVSGEVRSRLLLLAGSLACRAAFLGRRLDDMTALRRFGTLAGQYGAESGDPLLIGQVACLRSRTAFERGHYAKAADIAARGRPLAHPAQGARLAAYEAEALAAAGRDPEARNALEAMRASSVRALRWTDGDEAIFAAVTLAHLHDWVPAADLAQHYADGEFDNDREGVGWAHATVGRCLIGGDRPDPAGAAHAGILALDATAGPDAGVLRRTASLHADISRRWPGVAEVTQLGEALATTRNALPAEPLRSLPPAQSA